jgi:hypothetical protein
MKTDQANKDYPMTFRNKAELKAAIDAEIQPLLDDVYAKGKREGEAAARGEFRDRALESLGRERGLIPASQAARKSSENAQEKSPAVLAARAGELQEEARKQGRSLNLVEAVKAAYEEAGLVAA